MRAEHIETVIVGGGQAGLSTGYHLARRGLPFVILEANERVGDSWRKRWDSLRLFTPARYSGLPGRRFPGPTWSFPGKDDVADYLEDYAASFELAVRTGVRVDGLSREGDRYAVAAGDRRFTGRPRRGGVGRVPATKGARLRRASSIRASCSCIPASTGLERSFRTAGSSSSAPRTRAPRSPSRWPANTQLGCPEGTRDRSLSALAAGGIGSASRWSGSWRRTC